MIQRTTCFRIDDAQHSFGLRQIEASGQKSPHRELARTRCPGTAGYGRVNQRLQHRQRTVGMQLRGRLAGVTSLRRPNQHAGRHRTDRGTNIDVDRHRMSARLTVDRHGQTGQHIQGIRARKSDNSARCRARWRGNRNDRVLEVQHAQVPYDLVDWVS